MLALDLVSPPVSIDSDEGWPMTLVGAVRCGNALILAADEREVRSDSTGGSTWSLVDKWHQVATEPVMWAWVGEGEVGWRWGEWFESQRDLSWDGIEAEGSNELRRLNLAAPHGKTAGIVVAGFVRGDPGIVGFDHTGQMKCPHREHEYAQGNSEFGFALARHWGARHSLSSARHFTELFALTVERDPFLQGLRFWSVTPDGVDGPVRDACPPSWTP